MIAISGGGIAGLATALAVLRAGYDATLIDIDGTLPQGGVQLAPNGWAALAALGLDNQLHGEATRLANITIRDLASGATLTRIDLDGGYASVTRAALIALLGTTVESNAKFHRITGKITHAVSRRTDQGGGVRLRLDSGTQLDVAAVIAADGIGGFGRAYVTGIYSDSSALPASETRVAMRVVLDRAHGMPQALTQPVSNLWLGDGAHIVHYPLNNGTLVNLVVTLDSRLAAQDWQTRLFSHQPALAHLAGRQDLNWVKTPLPGAALSAVWRRGRVVLAGDAAHPMPPNLAQGAGQSLIDAACLERWLVSAATLDQALSGYARERSSAVSKIVSKARTSGQVMAMKGLAAKIRNATLGFSGDNLLQSWLDEVWHSRQSQDL